MIKYGKISELGTGNKLGFARVTFIETGIVSDWLSLPCYSSKSTKRWIPLEVNTLVACALSKDNEQGEIIKATWTSSSAPPSWASETTDGVLFPDGTEIYYDFDSNKLIINANNAIIEINGGTLGGLVKADVLKIESEKDKDILDTFLQVLQTPIPEPGNGANSAFQAALLAALGTKETGVYTDLENPKIKQ